MVPFSWRASRVMASLANKAADLAEEQAIKAAASQASPLLLEMARFRANKLEGWNNDICCCFNVKGAGCVPCCIPNFCCPCMPMLWASAMSHLIAN